MCRAKAFHSSSATLPLRENWFTPSCRRLRSASSFISTRSTATMQKWAGMPVFRERSNRAGTSFRQVRSPPPPKMTNMEAWSFSFVFTILNLLLFRFLLANGIPQVQVVVLLPGADKVQPWRCFGKKLHPRDQSRARPAPVSAGQLRGDGEEKFVDAAIGHEFTEQGRAAFVEKQRYAELGTQKFENGSRRNDGTFERPDFRGAKRPGPARCENLFAGFGGDDQCWYAGRAEHGSGEVHSAASAYHHLERRRRLPQDLRAVARIQITGFRVNPGGNEQVLWDGLVKSCRSHHDGVRRGPEEPHDETVGPVESADIASPGMAGDFIADYPINRAHEVADYIGPLGAGRRKPEIAAVSDSQFLRQNGMRRCFPAVDQRADGRCGQRGYSSTRTVIFEP